MQHGWLSRIFGSPCEECRIPGMASEAELFGMAWTIGGVALSLVCAKTNRFLRVNPAACAFWERSESELKRLTFADITHPDDLNKDLREWDRCRRGEIEYYVMDKRYLMPDDREKWGRLTVGVLRDSEGAPMHSLSQVLNIHDYEVRIAGLRDRIKFLEAQLRASKEGHVSTRLDRYFDAWSEGKRSGGHK